MNDQELKDKVELALFAAADKRSKAIAVAEHECACRIAEAWATFDAECGEATCEYFKAQNQMYVTKCLGR